MNKITWTGLGLLAIGVILWIAYGLFLGFDEIMRAIDFVTGSIGALVLLGFIILIISIFIEQRRDSKEMKEKINKEDLKP